MGAVVSCAQARTRSVSSIVTVSVFVEPVWIVRSALKAALGGDLPPKSVRTGNALRLNESLGAPTTGATCTKIAVARTTSMLSCRNFGSLTRTRLRADGAPPTAKLSSSGVTGGLNTKLLNCGLRSSVA